MGSLTSPLVLNLGSTPGEASGPGIAQVNTELFGANCGFYWTAVGAGFLVATTPWENGFVPATFAGVNPGDYAFGSTCALNTTVSVPPKATDRINCLSAFVKSYAINTSPQCRLEFRVTAGPIHFIDIDPRTGKLIAKSAGVLNPQIQRLVLPLYLGDENVSIYRVSFAFDSLGVATGIPRFYPRSDNVTNGGAVFGGTQLEHFVTVPSAFISPSRAVQGSRIGGQTARQTTTPNLKQKVLGAGLSPYTIDPWADQDAWIQCDLLAGNTVNLPQAINASLDMPTGSRLLVTQSATAVGGVTTITGAVNSILAPGGPTSPNTTVTFPSTDYPNVTQMLLIKTDVLNQWQIISTSAGGSAGGLFLQAGAGAVLRTFQNKDRDRIDVRDFGTDNTGATDCEVNFQKAIDALLPNQTLVASGTFQLGSSLYLRKSNCTFDFRSAKFTKQATIVCGDIANPATSFDDIVILGGEYHPVGDAALYPTANYNPVTIVIGKRIQILNPKIYTVNSCRGISIQTDTTWGVNPFNNIQDITVEDVEIYGDGNAVDGVDITSVGNFDNMITNVRVNGIVNGSKRGFNVASTSDAYYNKNIDINLRVKDASLVAGIYKAVKSGTANIIIDDALISGLTFRNLDQCVLSALIKGTGGSLTTAFSTQDAGLAASNTVKMLRISGAWVTGISPGMHDTNYNDVAIDGATTGIGVVGFRSIWQNVVFKNCVTTCNNFYSQTDIWKSAVTLGAGANPILLADNFECADGVAQLYSLDLHGESTITIANGAVALPFGATALFSGQLLVNGTGGIGDPAIFIAGGATTYLVGGPAGVYSPTAGLAAHVNVYYNGANQIEIQNLSGVQITLRLFSIRMRNSP